MNLVPDTLASPLQSPNVQVASPPLHPHCREDNVAEPLADF